MRPSFYPRLVNNPFDDPGVFIPFLFENRAILFDAGDNYPLSPRDILKISHVFVSHTHIDHFAGFDRMLRLFLGREKILSLYGPDGFLKNVEGKLAAYCWNLAESFTHPFAVEATEVRSDRLLTNCYLLKNKFIPLCDPVAEPFPANGMLLKEPSICVSAVILDHRIPCLGFSLKEQFHVNIIKDSLERLGLGVGPWLKCFKNVLFEGQPADSLFEVMPGKTFPLGELTKEIATITPGQKITYITDVGCTPDNVEKIIALARDSDHLFIESAFLEGESELAGEKYHLTATQAGMLAAEAGAKQFTLFHFSPRYSGMEHLFREEAEAAFKEYRQ